MNKIKTFLKQFPRYWVTAASAWTSKIVVSLVQIVSIRSLLSYLGEDRYAVYLIAYSLIVWFGLAQCCIGASLQNIISEHRAKNESYDKYMSAVLQIVSVLLIVSVFIILFAAAPIQKIIFSEFSYIDEIRDMPIIAVLALVTIVSAFTHVALSYYFAILKGYISNIMPAISSSLSMILIVVFNHYHICNSIMSALLIFTLPQMFLFTFLFIKVFKPYFGRLFKINKDDIKKVFIRGLKFHGILIMGAAYGQIDYLMMSRTISASNDIVAYSLYMRIFSSAFFIYFSLISAVWPHLSEMFIKKQFAQIKRMLINNILCGLLLILLCAGVFYFLFDFIIGILTPNIHIDKSILLFAAISIYMFFKVIVDGLSIFLQSINAVRSIWKYMPFMIILNAGFQYYFSKIYGINGIVLGLLLSLALTGLWVIPMKVRKVFKDAPIN
ncbi:MAG: MATE family efflux transporter [Elusimicrobiota bacterium]|jgi:O-antigen/teichoic acid export membrane protein|nr:MATE family efflux transporter [Elusimicrobiota bacterium]